MIVPSATAPGKRLPNFRPSGFDLFLCLLTALIYELDLTLQAGKAIIILLILVIVLAGRTQNQTRLAVWSGICMALTIGGYFVRHGYTFNPDYTARRAICIFAFMAAAAVLLRNQSLARARAQRTLLLEAAAAAIFTRDAAGRIMSWSQGAEALYGFSAAQAVGRNSHELLREEEEERGEAQFALAATGRWHGELRRRNAAGAAISVLCSCVRQTNGRGTPPIILESGTDVTAFRELETQLRHSEAHIRSIFETASVAIWEENFTPLAPYFLAPQAREISDDAAEEHLARVRLGACNQVAMQLMNGGAVPAGTGTLLRHCPAPLRAAYLAAAIAGNPSFQAETSFLLPGGERKHVLISAKFLPRGGGFGQALLNAVDITMQKIADEELAALTARLGQVNRNATLGELASIVHSQIETPLGAIAGHGSAAARLLHAGEGADAQVSALMQQVIQEAKAASGSIAQIRAFLRRGKSSPQSRPLGALLETAATLLERDFSAQLVSLRLELAPGLPEIAHGGFWLEHAVLYILLIFLQELTQTDTRNRVLYLRAATAHGKAVLEFYPGIRQAHIGEAVDGLSQWGEGFYLCRTAVEAHGGTILAWAQAGRLTSLKVSFPA